MHYKTNKDDISAELTLNAKCRQTMNQLVLNGADINYQCENGWCLLFEFVVLGLEEEVKYFSARGLDLYIKDTKGRNALFWAIHKDNTSMVGRLLSLASYIKDDNEEVLPLLHYAVYKQNTRIVESFLNEGININSQDQHGHTALDYAKKYKLETMIKFLTLKGGSSTNLEQYKDALSW